MKKLPIWAIYLADFMCVASALLIAFNYFIDGLPMDIPAILLCAVMVLSATVMMCIAQFFHFKYTKLSKEGSEPSQLANIEENFQIIFKQVSAIKRDNSTLNANFSSLLSRYNSASSNDDVLMEKLIADSQNNKAKLEDFENKFAKEEDIARLKLETEDSIENFKADVEIELGKLEDIDNAVKNLQGILEEINTKAELKAELPEPEETSDIEDIEEAEEDDTKEETDIDAEYEGYEDDASDEADGVDPSNNISQMSLMSRALNNTQQSQSILGSFAKINDAIQNSQEESYNEAEDSEGEDGFVDIDDFDDIDDMDDDLADIMKLGEQNNNESSLTINAMLGLGNKPYIRGNAPELSESEGTLMDFVEIGKWRYSFKDLSGKAKVSIWLNDEKISNNGEVSISEGENLEIDTNFSQ